MNKEAKNVPRDHIADSISLYMCHLLITWAWAMQSCPNSCPNLETRCDLTQTTWQAQKNWYASEWRNCHNPSAAISGTCGTWCCPDSRCGRASELQEPVPDPQHVSKPSLGWLSCVETRETRKSCSSSSFIKELKCTVAFYWPVMDCRPVQGVYLPLAPWPLG